jgi:hypothetical protein
MHRIFILFICASAVFIKGCGNNQYDADIKVLDSLRQQVSDIKTELYSLDSTRLKKISDQVFEDLRLIQRSYRPDSVELSSIELINAYQKLHRQNAHYTMLRSRLTQSIPYSEKQLDNLLYDLREQTIKKSEAGKYISVEKKSCTSLFEAYNAYKSGTLRLIKLFDSLHPLISDFKQAISASGTAIP